MWTLSKYLVASRPLPSDSPEAARRILFSTRTCTTLLVAESLYERLLAGRLGEIAPAQITALSAAKIIVDREEDELGTILAENAKAIAETEQLYECIQPTAACNLACTYCGQNHELRTLSERNQDLLIARIAARLATGRYKRLKTAWFGGEPLSAMKVIRRMAPLLAETARQHGCGYTSAVVTNGIALTRELARELQHEHGVEELEITLDGPARTHDARRVTKRGGPSFERIHANLRAIAADAELTAKITVRCNVDSTNHDAVQELIDTLADEGLQQRIHLYFAPIHDWSNGADRQSLSAADYAQQELLWLAYMRERGFAVPLVPQRKHSVCMAVNPSSELTDPYGALFNCTEVSLVKRLGTPNSFALGQLGEAPRASENASRLAGFYGDVGRGEYPCATCPMFPVCGGGCPKQWTEGTAACPSAKLNLPDRLPLLLANA